MVLILRIRLKRIGLIGLVEVRQNIVNLGERIRWSLVAIGIGPLIPKASAEDTILRRLTDCRGLTILAIAVVLIDSTRADAFSYSRVLRAIYNVDRSISLRLLSIELRIVVVVGVRLYIYSPAV